MTRQSGTVRGLVPPLDTIKTAAQRLENRLRAAGEAETAEEFEAAAAAALRKFNGSINAARTRLRTEIVNTKKMIAAGK